MKRKQYEKPSIEVVVLNQKPTLLQASVDPVDPFTPGGDPLNLEP